MGDAQNVEQRSPLRGLDEWEDFVKTRYPEEPAAMSKKTFQSTDSNRCNFLGGHDECLYHVVKDYLPEEALYMIRYHSCYLIHREGAYQHLMNDHDQEMLPWVRAFNPYDLYFKSHKPPNVKMMKPYYDT